jgi:hypothetical protein
VQGQRTVTVGGSRRFAATPNRTGGGRGLAGTPGRTDAATLAADLRPYPGVPTQENTPPSPPLARRERKAGRAAEGGRLEAAHRQSALLAAVGLESLEDVAERCRALRRRLGLPVTRWTPAVLAEVLAAAIFDHDWPAAVAVPALLAVAADPATRSPGRLACAGPWWDTAETGSHHLLTGDEAAELEHLEAGSGAADRSGGATDPPRGRSPGLHASALRDDAGGRGVSYPSCPSGTSPSPPGCSRGR